MPENAWEARQRDCETTGLRDHGTTRLRDDETTGLRDDETTGRRDHGTTGRRDDGTTRPRETLEKHRRSQAFSVFLSRARLCEAVRGSLASEGCSCVADKEIGLDG